MQAFTLVKKTLTFPRTDESAEDETLGSIHACARADFTGINSFKGFFEFSAQAALRFRRPDDVVIRTAECRVGLPLWLYSQSFSARRL
jgi:hypothetical protein